MITELILNQAFAADEAAAKGSNFTSFMPLILITAVFYFLVIRPQQKKNKDHQNKLKTLNRGDEIITSGGIVGTITNIKADEEYLIVEIAKDVKIKIHKMHIADILPKTSTDKKIEKKIKKQDEDSKKSEQSDEK